MKIIQNILTDKGSKYSVSGGMVYSKLEAQGWSSSIELKKGIVSTYQWFKESQSKIREVRI